MYNQQTNKISAASAIQTYKEMGENTEFPTLYMYLLYVCGGDFSIYDNLNLVKDYMNIEESLTD